MVQSDSPRTGTFLQASSRTPGHGSHDWIDELIAAHRTGYSLAQPFYTDPCIFERDVERVFQRSWVFAGHISRVSNAGDYFLFQIGTESIIVIRGQGGQVHALHNVCRHRGSRVCLAAQGNRRTLVCPYHAWTYATDGRLLSAPAMPEGFDAGQFGLRPCPVKVVEGMIFLSLGEEAPRGFDAAFQNWQMYLQPHGLERAKIAASITWPVKANWKLVVENFGECYHCGPAHPEYCSVMAHAIPDTHKAKKPVDEYATLTAQWESRVKGLGHLAGRSEEPGGVGVCVRIPIREGFETQSRDGRLVAPLMGDFKESDGGYTGGRIYPLNYFLASCDHAVIPRFTPLAPQLTEVEMIWLVREDAVEGRDYDVGNLTWLWKVTTDQDKKITEDNQAGVNSLAYRPGPYSITEQGLTQFTMWYLNQIR